MKTGNGYRVTVAIGVYDCNHQHGVVVDLCSVDSTVLFDHEINIAGKIGRVHQIPNRMIKRD